MIADSQKEIDSLKIIGPICAPTLRKIMEAARAGTTARAFDEIGRVLLDAEGARSVPQVTYNFPGTICISVSPGIAHGIPGEHILNH